MTTLTETPTQQDITREIEQFLYHEAALLDAWRLYDWLTLLTDDCNYHVPTTDAIEAQDPTRRMFIIADSHDQIVDRVNRLESDAAYVERPRSRTRRLITNVRADYVRSGRYSVNSNFAVSRIRCGVTDLFIGQYQHLLVRGYDGAFRIAQRRATFDSDSLRPQGKVGFIL